MKKLTIRKTNVNWLELINMALNREGWGKTYTIYSYGDVTIQATLDDYNFRYQKGNFYINCNYKIDDNNRNNTTWVAYRTENFNIEEFQRLMKRSIISLLKNINKKVTRECAEDKYQELKTYRWNIDTDDYIREGFEDQYDAIMAMDVEYQGDLLTSLSETVANKMNKPFDEAVAKFCETPIPMPNIDALIASIQEELDAE